MDALIQFLPFTLALRFLTWDELSTRASTENYDNIRSGVEPKSAADCPNFGDRKEATAQLQKLSRASAHRSMSNAQFALTNHQTLITYHCLQ
jgi:hypothetical protein